MLYERWRKIAQECRNETALFALGARVTFGQLASQAEQAQNDSPIVYPQGRDFIITLLKSWQNGQIAMPLEPGQAPVAIEKVPANCVHLKLTSATGGRSRMVAFTPEQLAADADNIVATMGLRPDWPNLAVISLAHSYGFSNLVLPLLLHGIPLIMTEAPLPQIIRSSAAMAENVTLPAVPALWRIWHEANAIPKNTRLAISAGAPLPLVLENEVFARHGLKLHNFYGSSECGGIAYDYSLLPRTDAAIAGRPLKNVTVRVNRAGCLEIQSAAVGFSYLPEPGANLANGIFTTSDLAEICEGEIYLKGRAGDLINVAGRKIAPEDIERQLLSHADVRACLVLGIANHDQRRGDTIVACVAANKPLAVEDLKQFLLDKLPAWQVPREWFFVEDLDANSRGKLSRAEWRNRFLDRQKSPGI